MTEQEVLAQTLDATRALTKGYLKKLADADPMARPAMGDYRFNSKLWICAHLTWTEWYMILNLLKGEDAPYPWVEAFFYGSEGDPSDQWPTFEEVIATMDDVHQRSLEVIRSLESLDVEATMARFRWTDTYRNFIIHVIRHEGIHCGHLGWFGKMV